MTRLSVEDMLLVESYHDHIDNTHFHSHLSALPSTTTTPQLSSVIVKQENQFC